METNCLDATALLELHGNGGLCLNRLAVDPVRLELPPLYRIHRGASQDVWTTHRTQAYNGAVCANHGVQPRQPLDSYFPAYLGIHGIHLMDDQPQHLLGRDADTRSWRRGRPPRQT